MITYRQATPQDVSVAAPLLFEVSFISRFIYGAALEESESKRAEGAHTQGITDDTTESQRAKRIEEKIAASFLKEDSKNSYRNIYVAEALVSEGKKVIGLVNYYEEKHHEINKAMHQYFPAKALSVIEPMMVIPDNSLYISALVVDQPYRNHQVGLHLIQHVKEEAKKLHRKQICLHVWQDNERGIHFYKKNNFIFHELISLNTDSDLLPPSKKLWLISLFVD